MAHMAPAAGIWQTRATAGASVGPRRSGWTRSIQAFDLSLYTIIAESTRSIAASTEQEAIENIGDFENPGNDAHAILGYPTNRRVAQAVAGALGV